MDPQEACRTEAKRLRQYIDTRTEGFNACERADFANLLPAVCLAYFADGGELSARFKQLVDITAREVENPPGAFDG